MALIIGSLMVVLNLGIQVLAVSVLINYFTKHAGDGRLLGNSFSGSRSLAIVMMVLFLGHILQFATWASLFVMVGEFEDFGTAFYHSTVNFASLGYGDIVMSEQWRLLGALEACNGVLMFGLSASTILTVMNGIFKRSKAVTDFQQKQNS